MANIQEVFERKETKYVISRQQYEELLKRLGDNIEPDVYPTNTNCSVYYDTAEFQLVSRSIEKPLFKQKLRVRSYNVPTLEDGIYVELKKKYKGVGNKRRVAVKLKDYYDYLRTGELETDNPIIKAEIDYCFEYYKLQPALYIAYDRKSYCATKNPGFRLTFDFDIRSRVDDLRLEAGDHGKLFFDNGEVVMEAKNLGAFPVWFVEALSKMKIYPTSFSKYGYVYQQRFNDIVNKTKEENVR